MDNWLARIVCDLHQGTLTAFFRIVTHFGDLNFIAMAAAFLALYLLAKRKWFLTGVFTIGMALAGFTNLFLKIFLSRARPSFCQLVAEKNSSFPSGHSLGIVVFGGFILFLTNRGRLKNKTRIALNTIVILGMAIVGLSRIYLGVHWASDVLTSYLIGGLILFLMHKTVRHLLHKKSLLTRLKNN